MRHGHVFASREAESGRTFLRAVPGGLVRPRGLLVGLGESGRGDAAAGLEVIDLVRRMVPAGVRVLAPVTDPAALAEAWRDVPLAVVVDAMRCGGPAGGVGRVEVLPGARPVFTELQSMAGPVEGGGRLDDALAIGRRGECLPRRLVIFGIEGRDFSPGAEFTGAVRAAVRATAERVLAEFLPR